MASENRISAVMVRSLTPLLDRLGLDGAGFGAALGVDDATDLATWVDGVEADRLLAERAATAGEPALGLALAEATASQPLGIFGHMVWLSPTVGDGLDRGIRMFAAMSRRATLELVRIDDARVALRHHVVRGAEHAPYLCELAFASCTLWARAATGGAFVADAMRFEHAAASRDRALRARYERVFGAPVTFDAPATDLVFARAMLALPLATQEPTVAATLERRLAEISGRPGHTAFLERVRRAIADNVAGADDHRALARRVGVSPRTLRRRLAEAKLTIRALVDNVRRTRAEERLAAGIPVKEIAFELGFSEPSALTRAYKRWTGRPPSARRG